MHCSCCLSPLQRRTSMVKRCLIPLLVLLLVPVFLSGRAPAHSEILDHQPDWHQGQQSNALIDADTGKPLVLTAQERALCIKAMDGAPDTAGLMMYHQTLEHLRRGEPVIMGDVIFLNRPLMAVQQPQYHLSDG